MRHALLKITVDINFFHAFDAGQQTVAQHADALVFGGHFQARQTECFAHADNLMRRQGAGTKAAFMTTAVHLRFQTHPWFAANEQRAHAFRAVGFVCAKAHQIHFKCLQVDHHFTGRLRRIDMKNNPAFSTNVADFRNRLNHTDFVIHVQN